MRPLNPINDAQQAQHLADFLSRNGINNELEQIISGYQIWIIDEDDFTAANEMAKSFQENPKNPKFDKDLISPARILKKGSSSDPLQSPFPPQTEPQAYATLSFIFTCIILFAASFLTAPKLDRVQLPYPMVAIYSSEVTQELLFDFPKAYEIIEQAAKTYGTKALENPSKLPPEGQQLVAEFKNTPWWQGFYSEILLYIKGAHTQAWESQAPLFEKIRQGEIWRLFTPALLHLDIFHILFNMLWVYILGKQIEIRIGIWRYILFCVVVGVFANIVQYLVSGPNFIGFSGIICGFFTFIWVRQRQAPWEGYQLNRSTITMIGLFVGGLLLIQVASFIMEVYANTSIAPMIANAAHIAGGVAGWFLGRYKYFAWNNS